MILLAEHPFWSNSNSTLYIDEDNGSQWWSSFAPEDCPLLNYESEMDKVRLVTELVQLIGAFLYILAALRESRFLGYKMFIENLVCAMDLVEK